MRGQRISRNFLVLATGYLISRGLAFFVTIALTRALLAEGFGLVAFATSVLGYAALIIDLGFDAFGPLEIARGTTPIRKLVENVVTLRLLLSVLAYAALAIFTFSAPIPTNAAPILLLYGLSLITNAFDLQWVFVGSERMSWSAISEIALQTIMLAAIAAVVHRPADLVFVPLIFLAARAVSVGVLLHRFRQLHGGIRLQLDVGLLKDLVPKAIPMCGASTVALVSHNFDLVLIGLWIGSTAAGLYGAAYRIVWLPGAFLTAYLVSLRPTMARGLIDGYSTVEGLLARSLRVTTAAGVGVAAWLAIYAGHVTGALFGAGFIPSMDPLRFLLVAFVLIVVSRQYRLALTAFNRQVTDFRIMLTAAAVNIGANLLLIPRFHILGAAAATLLSETVLLVMSVLSVRRLVGPVPFVRVFLRPSLCLAMMLAVIYVLRHQNVFMQSAAAILAYTAGVFALRIITAADIRTILASVRSGGPPPMRTASDVVAKEALTR